MYRFVFSLRKFSVSSPETMSLANLAKLCSSRCFFGKKWSQVVAPSALLIARRNHSGGKNCHFDLGQPSFKPCDFKSIEYFVENRVAHICLNRPGRMNAIDGNMPRELQASVDLANFDDNVKVILLYGKDTFCSGYDLKLFAESPRGSHPCSQEMPWDPYLDYKYMGKCTECITSLWRSLKPTICKIKGVAIGGGSDMALSCDVTFMASDALIGYPPSRLWGCPTTAMWVYRVGIERAKRIMFTGDLMTGEEAERIGLVGEAVPEEQLDGAVDAFIDRIITVPSNQLFFHKQVINNAVEMMGLQTSQRLATVFDGMTRHTPEGVEFQKTAREKGFKKAVAERDAKERAYPGDMDKKQDE